jgi:hypothetical protein
MKDFLNKTWVKIVGWVGLIVCAALLILGGTSVAEIGKGVELTFGIIEAVILLVAFIKKMLEKKDSAGK